MFKGASHEARVSAQPADMTNVVMNYSEPPTYGKAYGYGANAREAADERLLEQVRTRRAVSKQRTAAFRQATGVPKKPTSVPIKATCDESIDEKLGTARRRRAWLEEELCEAKAIEASLLKRKDRDLEMKKKVKEVQMAKEERERKRQAAFKRKLEGTGGKPTGVTKAIA
ncbi:hypothetical protein BDW02DRAFT_651776 [Decorospora gaudefroyi]|uniref:Uncharacterized protein n=1 Tax=Decorospora gaudefroyi TaxID=184978 RepID=A0A6A5K5W5_9PLEO|nr:hypothetical protein BDW02DRAFT_651776 [Decorospora gaudefroyi]